MATYKNIFTFIIIVLRATMLQSCVPVSNDATTASETKLEECLRKDSISCLQVQMYRNAKSFLEQDRVDLIGGFYLIRKEENNSEAKSRNTEDILEEKQILGAQDFERRESAIESFVYQKMIAFLQEHSIRWDMPQVLGGATTGRAITEAVPAHLRRSISKFVTAARGKKILLKILLPFLVGAKLKIAVFLALVLAYVGINIIAKKAILLSLISIAISAFIASRKFLSHRAHHPYEAYGAYVGHHGGGWDGVSGVGYGHAEYGSDSSPVAHTLAYGTQKVFRK